MQRLRLILEDYARFCESLAFKQRTRNPLYYKTSCFQTEAYCKGKLFVLSILMARAE